MMILTDNAVNHLRTLLAGQPSAGPGTGLRIAIERGGCSGLQYEMRLDEPQADDQIVERDGVRVLVDPASRDFLRGSTVDYHDDLTGSGFRIDNPNARRTCGCGTSFEPAPATAPAVAEAAGQPG